MHSDSLMVPHGSQQSDRALEEGDVNEQLYQKWFEEGYDIYDEDYVKWLIQNQGDQRIQKTILLSTYIRP